MNSAFTAAQAWAVVLGVGIPLFVMWWWARRHAPISGDQREYSVGYRTAEPEPAVHAAGLAAAPHSAVAMPEGMVDAPVMANPAHLEPPTAVAASPASIAAEPLPATVLPPEPAGSDVRPATSAVFEVPAAVPAASTPTPVPPTQPASAVPPTARVPPGSMADEAPVAPPVVAVPPEAAVAVPAEPKPGPAHRTAVKAAHSASPPAPATPPAPAVAQTTPTEMATAKAAPEPTPPAAAAVPVTAPAAPVNAPAAPAVSSGADDDLSKILNVTPQITEILHQDGIHSYRELAAADPAHLKELLEAAGLQVDPSTWPQQGRFAAGGKWKQLQNLQNRLSAG